jgi:hypothetical protein
MRHDYLFDFHQVDLDRFNLAAGVILSIPLGIPPVLAAELIIFKKRVERALLLTNRDEAGNEWPQFLGAGTSAPLVMIRPDYFRAIKPEDLAKITSAIHTLEEHRLFIDDGYEGNRDLSPG